VWPSRRGLLSEAAARDHLRIEPSELQADLVRAFFAGCSSDLS
jgi:hypothetical protein